MPRTTRASLAISRTSGAQAIISAMRTSVLRPSQLATLDAHAGERLDPIFEHLVQHLSPRRIILFWHPTEGGGPDGVGY